MRTRTRDTSQYGLDYIRGLLRMKTKRNINNIARTVGVPEQNMQQFISDSPWSGDDLISVLQQDISAHPQFQEESVLIIDESADEKAGEYSAGAGRQHNGRLGKVDMSQVGVFLSLTNSGYHNWIDGELYIVTHVTSNYVKWLDKGDICHYCISLKNGLRMIMPPNESGLECLKSVHLPLN